MTYNMSCLILLCRCDIMLITCAQVIPKDILNHKILNLDYVVAKSMIV